MNSRSQKAPHGVKTKLTEEPGHVPQPTLCSYSFEIPYRKVVEAGSCSGWKGLHVQVLYCSVYTVTSVSTSAHSAVLILQECMICKQRWHASSRRSGDPWCQWPCACSELTLLYKLLHRAHFCLLFQMIQDRYLCVLSIRYMYWTPVVYFMRAFVLGTWRRNM